MSTIINSMGNCCSPSKKPKNHPMHNQTPATKRLETAPQQCLKFKSKDFNFSYKLEYHQSKPLSSFLNHIILNHPELIIDEILVTSGHQIISNFNLTLKDLGILPSDALFIETRPQSKKEPSSISMSNEEIAEEESTTKLQIVGIKAKLSLGKVKTESTGEAAMLWRSAMPSPKHIMKNYTKDADASSLINPMDLTIDNKYPVQLVPYDVKNGQSVLLDSDDSYLKTDVKSRDSMNRHPYDFFRDLQGPFSVLKQL